MDSQANMDVPAIATDVSSPTTMQREGAASPLAVTWLIVVSTLLRLVWAGSLGPGNDEAYHYLFVTHPDWSYFDHPPLMAMVERFGLAVTGGVATIFTLRFGFVLLFAASTWLLARLATRFFGPRAGFWAALALNVSGYHSAAAGVFILPDGPLLFFWLLTLERLAAAFDLPWPAEGPSSKPARSKFDSYGTWLCVGLAWGGAMLSKYHGLFLPVGTCLFCLINRDARRALRTPGPYLAAVAGLAVFSPVLIWNAEHGWVSFAFQGSRALAEGAAKLRVDALLTAVLGQAVYLFPWIWLPMAVMLLRQLADVARGRSSEPAALFLTCQAVVPLGAFLAVATIRPILPHWTLIGFVALYPLLGRAWAAASMIHPQRSRRRLIWLVSTPIALACLVAAQTHWGVFQRAAATLASRLAPTAFSQVSAARPTADARPRVLKGDPTADMYGWDQVVEELDRRGLLDRPSTFLFTNNWTHSGQLAFAARRRRSTVLCFNQPDARGFAFWSRPDAWLGRDGVLVALNDNPVEPDCYDSWFSKITPIGSFEVVRGGVAVRRIRLFLCVNHKRPFPFDHLAKFGQTSTAAAATSPVATRAEAAATRR